MGPEIEPECLSVWCYVSGESVNTEGGIYLQYVRRRDWLSVRTPRGGFWRENQVVSDLALF